MANKWAMEFAAGPHSHDNILQWNSCALNIWNSIGLLICQIFELPIILMQQAESNNIPVTFTDMVVTVHLKALYLRDVKVGRECGGSMLRIPY